MTIDLKKPIEYQLSSGEWVPATIVKHLRGDSQVSGGVRFGFIYGNKDVEYCCETHVKSLYVRNVPEPAKKVWTVTAQYAPSPKVAAKLYNEKPNLKVGEELPNYTGYKVIAITETELAA